MLISFVVKLFLLQFSILPVLSWLSHINKMVFVINYQDLLIIAILYFSGVSKKDQILHAAEGLVFSALQAALISAGSAGRSG
jgi:Na+-transporting NADH:ubiquinone oxidoreductase subunit NqrA